MKKLPSGAPLQKVDGIHSRKLGFFKERNYVYAKFEGHLPSYLPIELLTMLVIGSRYENKKRFSQYNSINYGFRVVREPEVFLLKNEGYRVRFLSDDGVIVEIRQLEIARVLFFHNIHLVKAAFRQNGLAGLAQIISDENIKIIKINRFNDYPFSRLNSDSESQHFAWLILDQKARISFNSILKEWMMSENETHEFSFQPPPMMNWKIGGCGDYVDRAGVKVFVMNEVTVLYNPNFFHSERVIIDHHRSKNILVSEPSNGSSSVIQRTDDDSLLDLSVDPVFGKRIDRVSESSLSFTFGNSPRVEMKDNGEESQVKPRVDTKSDQSVEKTSVGDINERGEARELDHGINKSEEDDDEVSNNLIEAEPTDKFRIFEKVIQKLDKHPGFNVTNIICYKMPSPKTGRLAATRTKIGKIVQCHVATVTYRKISFIIIEIDTENMKVDHSISTLIVGFKKDATESLSSVLQSCSDEGVRWPRDKIHELSVVAEYCHHPRRMKKVENKRQSLTPEEYQKVWLEKIMARIKEAAKCIDIDPVLGRRSHTISEDSEEATS
ncbi:Tn7-like element transposition protein TnsE [Halomonas vilamensis]|uniref:Tn7-like element transposition protein TnsE n=1 Tax=Vreelandella vilamensis TaxID=531309 RepID=A0ABU1H5G2_9GAMM|nr:Tn7-like element transposition protein TnsE [Halomonas vilamensis]MDR5899454.1 Tn7-like element transposition protein TnsE [Halomonas vilamensis]